MASTQTSNATLRVIVHNLQKKPGLASKLIALHDPDIFLAQEIHLSSEDASLFPAYHVSKRGRNGTAIYTNGCISNIRCIQSPHSEHLWTIVKKTTVAHYKDVELVTFHGYNGWPRRDEVQKLLDHVHAVLAVVEKKGPAIFAGDFNTWTEQHLEAVKAVLSEAGFGLVYSWLYPGGQCVLDHAFARGMTLIEASTFETVSDHLGACLVLRLCD